MDLLDDPEFLNEFVAEAMENLSDLDGLFVTLERDPDDRPTLAAVFRGMHTIKGTSGFLALHRIEKLSHAGEDLLSLLRDGRLRLDMAKTTGLLTLMDTLRDILTVLQETGAEPEGDDTSLLETLRALAVPSEQAAASPAPGGAAAAPPQTASSADTLHPADATPPPPEPAPASRGRLGDLLVELGLATRFAVDRALAAQQAGDGRRLGEILIAEGLLYADQLLEVLDEQGRRASLAARLAVAAQAAQEAQAAATSGASPVDDGDDGDDGDDEDDEDEQERDVTDAVAGTAPVAGIPAVAPFETAAAPAAHPNGSSPGAPPPSPATPAPTASVPSTTTPPAAMTPPSTTAPRTTPAAPATSPGPPATAGKPPAGAPAAGRGAGSDPTVRLDVGILDGLVDLVGELVLSRNRLLRESGDQPASQATREIDRLTSDLQHQVLRTRVQQVRVAWAKIPRIARDTALAVGKTVRVEMDGESTELDRSLVEAVKDPLMHLVRNAVDHGIETPQQRRAAGKPEEGQLRLTARQEAGDVVMEISDDGAGIDPVRIKAVAVSRGVIDEDRAAGLSDEDALDLIFEPGFSTAAAVTSISGRGVGMDVVRTALTSLGGSLEVRSTLGAGTTFVLRIPLTLAIMPALVVTVTGRRYILPEPAVVQIVRLRTAGGRIPLDRMPDGACLRWRGGLLPVVDMVEVMDGRSAVEGTSRRSHVVVVVQAQGRQLGLLVDSAMEIEEVVVKSLADSVNPHGVYSGATILGDGSIAPILDIGGLVRLTGLIGVASGVDEAIAALQSDERLLVCRAEDRHYAVPADSVRHVVRMPVGDVHWTTGAGTVVRIGEQLHAVRPLTSQYAEHGKRVSVIQVATGEGDDAEVLLLVDAVLDVITAPSVGVEGQGDVTATVLHDGTVVDVLEPSALTDRYVA